MDEVGDDDFVVVTTTNNDDDDDDNDEQQRTTTPRIAVPTHRAFLALTKNGSNNHEVTQHEHAEARERTVLCKKVRRSRLEWRNMQGELELRGERWDVRVECGRSGPTTNEAAECAAPNGVAFHNRMRQLEVYSA